LLTGDVAERVRILSETGQIPLAYLTAKTHGIKELEEVLEESLKETPEGEKVI